MDPDAWVPLAEIARPHGVRGELRLRLFNKTSDTLLGLDEVLVRLADGEEHEVTVERARRADDAILIKLFSVDSRDRAEELRGALICVRRRDFEEAEDGEFYAIDVVGAEVRLAGARIGSVAEILTYPSIEVLLVHADDALGDWEVPLTEMYIARVDVEGKLVELVSLDDIERVPRRKPKEPKAEGADAAADAKSARGAKKARRDEARAARRAGGAKSAEGPETKSGAGEA
jgi:16S rRNA processing protein RimM